MSWAKRYAWGVQRYQTKPYRAGATAFLLGFVLSIYGTYAFYAYYHIVDSWINWDAKIDIWMTREEVESVLGGPPGDYGRQWAYRDIGSAGAPSDIFRAGQTAQEVDAMAKKKAISIWWGLDYVIAVQFNEKNQAIATAKGLTVRKHILD